MDDNDRVKCDKDGENCVKCETYVDKQQKELQAAFLQMLAGNAKFQADNETRAYHLVTRSVILTK